MIKNYYNILKVKKTATASDIKKSYRELAYKYHPDVSEEESAHDFFVELNEAYQILSNAIKRKRYDLLFERYFEGKKIASYADLQRERIIRRHFNQWVEKARSRAKEYAKKQFKEYAKTIDCYFYSISKADGDPYYFYLHKDIGIKEGASTVGIHARQKRIKYKNITIPIPRSKRAQSFHNIGFGIKLVTLLFVIIIALCGFFNNTALLLAWGIVFAILLSGGIVCHLFYYFYGMKSIFYYAIRYPRVQEYIKKGFRSDAPTMITSSPFGIVLYAIRWLL